MLPERPIFPESEQRRVGLQLARYKILTDDHEKIVAAWMEQHAGGVAARWGPPDLAINPLATQCRQLVTPGLYGRAPTARNSSGDAAALLGPEGELVRGGFWSRQMHVQYLALGLGDVFVRLGVDENRRLVTRIALPHNLIVECDPDRPDRPTAVTELQVRVVDAEATWVWEVMQIPTPTRADPSWRVFRALPTGALGDDVSDQVLYKPGRTERGAMVGDEYPFRNDGRAILPWIAYRGQDTGECWNHLHRRGMHHGSLTAAMHYTFANFANRAASGGMAFLGNAVPFGDIEVQPDASNAVVASRAVQALPATVVFVTPQDPSQPISVAQVHFGQHLEQVAAYAREYEVALAVRSGLNPSDVTRQHANPTSGAALAISNAQKRELMEQIEEVFRRSDVELMEKAAVLLNLFGDVGTLPTTGYTITYARIDDSPQEAKERREAIEWEVANGMMSPIDAYLRLNPGATRDDAFVELTRTHLDSAQLERRYDEAREAAGLPPRQKAPESPTPSPGTDAPPPQEGTVDKVADTALNGAQVQSAAEIVASVAEGRLPRESGVAMLVRFFNLAVSDAESIMGSVGRTLSAPQPANTPAPQETP